MTAAALDDAGSLLLRKASLSDVPRITRLIQSSVRQLQAGDYPPASLELALQTAFTVDTQLIRDSTYYVIEAPHPASDLAACGGWSGRQTLSGGDSFAERDNTLLDPARDAARIRAFFVHPSWVRRGLGTRLLNHCEAEAMAAGFRRFAMAATLTGVPLYLARGYQVVERSSVPLLEGMRLPVVVMERVVTTK